MTGGFPQLREESQFGDDWIGPAESPLGVQCGPCGVLRNHPRCETTCNIPDLNPDSSEAAELAGFSVKWFQPASQVDQSWRISFAHPYPPYMFTLINITPKRKD